MTQKIKRGGRKGSGKRFSSPAHKQSEPTNFEKDRPVFSLKCDGDYCLVHCDKNDMAAFADQIHRLSSLTWQQLKAAPRHGLGYEKIERHSLQVPVPISVPEDATIIAFRFSGKKPMVGYRDKNTFHVLWLDRNFSVYKH